MSTPISSWFKNRGWKPFNFQKRCWKAYEEGKSGLVNAPTGTGKTLSIWGAVLNDLLENEELKSKRGIHLVWITPLRALATDLSINIKSTLTELNIDWRVEVRTSDTSSSLKLKQKKQLPQVLITTPESMSLLLSYEDVQEQFRSLKVVVVDELHELIGSKRGTQTELVLSRLRVLSQNLKTWALSATIGNLETALEVVVPDGSGILIREEIPKDIQVNTIIPNKVENFPWAGHMGLKLLPEIISKLETASSSLVFTNTRFQSERWYQAIKSERPEWEGKMALHHGSLNREDRRKIEDQLRAGELKCVVCTSSLDLGVDFSPVELVIQIGSPKGVGRFLQRAGRSGHKPGDSSRAVCCPTNTFELLEYAALKKAICKNEIESRFPLQNSLDVLSQHLVTLSLAGGFQAEKLFDEVRTSYAFRKLSKLEWDWVLDFITRGGPALRAYPEYSKVLKDEHNFYQVTSKKIATNHRMNIGTIVEDASITILLGRGKSIGSVEESFISRLKPGDHFTFAGRDLELIQLRESKAYVRLAKSAHLLIPKWAGGRMPLSSYLANRVKDCVTQAESGYFEGEEMLALKSTLEIQRSNSALPTGDELLFERMKLRDGYYNFIYPFQGRAVHEGLGALVAARLSRTDKLSASVMANDYGTLVLTTSEIPFSEEFWRAILSTENLAEDILYSLNSSEMAKRQFREIARVAGLVSQGYPGAKKTVKQVQISSGLLFDVFKKYDPDNLLLTQARREILERQLEFTQLKEALNLASDLKFRFSNLKRLSPFSFPLWSEQVQSTISSEKVTDRIERMLKTLIT